MDSEEITEKNLAATIIITTYNRWPDLRDCLASLPWREMKASAVEVLVMDDGSSDETATGVRETFPQVRLLRNKTRQGASYSRNCLGRAAQGHLLICLDDDVVVTTGWLEALLRQDDGRTLLGGRIVDYGGEREQGGPAHYTFIGKRLPCAVEKANVGISCNLAIPARVFEALGGFDEDLPYYFEDSDFCIRANKAGFNFAYVPEAKVFHKGSPVRVGKAIWMQERNSTFAMLKAYRGSWWRLALFTVLNGAWMGYRVFSWGIRGRFSDVHRLVSGWCCAYRDFWRRCRTAH